MVFDIEDLERWRDRLFNAIHSGFIINVNIHFIYILKNNIQYVSMNKVKVK